jgi:phosphoglycolate phosphatase
MLYLFDIDGTLISPGPAARKAINQAIENYTDVPPKLQLKDVAGMTDRLIVRNAILKAGKVVTSPVVIDKIVNDYLNLFERMYLESDGAYVYNDAIALLQQIKQKGHSVGLLTGNAERGAKIKLGRFDLFNQFPFGAFAEDGESRNELPVAAKRKADKYYNKIFKYSDIVLIGDTVEDAIAARVNGCKSIIVCRQPEWYDEIANAGADLIVDSLDDLAIKI